MEDFNEIYKKAGTLMISALKKYNSGDHEGGDRDRAEANRLYDMAEDEVNRESLNISQLYNESRNFGIIYRVIEANTENLCEDKSKRRGFKNVIKLIKEDKNLKNEFEFYDALTNPINVANPNLYVTEALNLKPNIDFEEAKKSNDKLINELRKNKFFELVDIDDDTMKLFESIEYVLFNKPQLKSLSDYTSAKNYIIEHVTDKNVSTYNETDNTNKNIDESLNQLVQKYDAILNEDEKKLLQTILETKDKEKLFAKYKEDTLKQIDETVSTLDKNDANQLMEIRNNIKEKKYNSRNILEDVSEFIEIKNVLLEKN